MQAQLKVKLHHRRPLQTGRNKGELRRTDTVGHENCLEFIGPASSYPGEWNDAPCSTIYRQWSCIWRDD